MSAQPKADAAVEVDNSLNSPAQEDSCQKSFTVVPLEDVEANVSKAPLPKQARQLRRYPKSRRHLHQAWASLSRFTVRCEDRWIWEVLGCCVAVACLVSIILILATNQDSSLSEQGPLSINAWVSIFTAVMKAAIMLVITEGLCQLKWLWFLEPQPMLDFERFDSASRGPWGSLLLLVRARPHYLATFGAILSIVALAIDPFSQQIIRYYSCFPASHTELAKLPRANNYTRDGIPRGVSNAELNTTLSTAIMVGAMPDPPMNDTDLMPFECHSGNCTFPSTEAGEMFQTIGLCHQCWDIANLIHVNNTNTSQGWALANWDVGPEWNFGKRPAYVGENALPYETDNNSDALYWSRKTLAMRPDFDDLITVDGIMLNVNDECNIEKSDDCPKHPWAFRCALYPCIKTMSANIVNSKLKERTLSTSSLRRTNETAVEVTTSINLTWSLAADRVLRNGAWAQCNPSPNLTAHNPVAVNSERKTLYTGRSAKQFDVPPSYYPSDCVFTLGYDISLGINQYLSWMFDPSDTAPYIKNAVMNTFSARGPQQYKAIYRAGKATLATTDAYFAQLTSFITAMMRQRGENAPDNWAQGQVLLNQTCIGVQWPWIALPALMVLFGVGFFLAALWKSVRKGVFVGAWKSSAVAPIWAAGLGTANVCTRSKIEEEAEKTKIQVVAENERWMLKVVKPDTSQQCMQT